MKTIILEEFDEIKLDSCWIRVADDFEDPAFYLIGIRIKTDDHVKSYYFDGVSEMYQKQIQAQEQKDCLLIDGTSGWAEIFREKNRAESTQYLEVDEVLLKHYIFRIGETEFNILAEKYDVQDQVREMFRKQEYIKNLVS